jgi:predicted deacetylase
LAVHVSIHDVSPAWERELDVALGMAHEAGVRPALLVVPDFHGRAPLARHPAFAGRLRQLEKDGHEIYLHGYYHRSRAWDDPEAVAAAARGRRSVLERARHGFAQRVVSASEAEFSDVSREEATARLDLGEQVLGDAGLTIRGFVAPAWSMPGWVLALLAARGYRFTEDHLRIHDPAGGRSRASVVLNYASRTPARLLSSALWCRLARPARRVLPARIAIHPADMRFALLRREIEAVLAWAAGDFVETGADLLG